MTTGTIFDIKRFAVHDGPGTRTTVFLKGCPLSCLWCHNPEGISPDPILIYHQNRCIHCGACVEACPKDLISLQDLPTGAPASCDVCGACIAACPTGAWEVAGRQVETGEVLAEIDKDILFFDESQGGVTFSGGEPLAQIDFLTDLLRQAKERGMHTTVDTSGCAPLEHFRRILPFTDLFLFDIKCLDDRRHRQFTGASNRMILDNFLFLTSAGGAVIVRVPLIPGINDSPAEIAAIGAFVRAKSRVQRIDLLPYHAMAREKYNRLGRAYALGSVAQPTHEQVEALQAVLTGQGFEVRIGG